MYQALYRKWRPKTFDELVGQEAVSATLKHQVAGNKLSHAYLFCGSRGTGKTSSAKILAKAVNCIGAKDGNPCCVCDICKGVDSESLMDVTEIDAASNSGVDNIRALREEAHFTPSVARYRVYIIDETHMLSAGAFNALLKILEEPPEHVLFILATTEIHKVPATILSRCQRFDFHRIDSAVITERLRYIAGQEEIDIDPEAALLIARLADGGMRDALSLLDLVSGYGGKITPETVSERIGLVGRGHLFALADAIASGDGGAALEVAQGLWEKSADYQRLCEQLIGFYRDVMVAKAVSRPEELIPCLPDELERYRSLAKGHSMAKIMAWLSTMQETLAKISKGTQRRAELEMGLLKMADPTLLFTAEGILERIEALENEDHPKRRKAKEPTPEKAPRKSGPETQNEPVAGQNTPEKIPAEKIKMEPFDSWDNVLGVLKQKNRALYGALAESAAYASGDLLLVDAGENSMFIQMVRGDSYAKESLRDAVQSVTGQKYRLGPYNPERYDVTQNKPDKLDEILKYAGELGVDIHVKD